MRSAIYLLVLCAFAALSFGQNSAPGKSNAAAATSNADAIRQVEDDWLKAERTTDIAAIERILSDDYAGVGSNGPVPGKAQLLKNLRPSAGNAPPYTVEKSDMRIFLVADTAVATYAKTYTAKENGNVAHEDMTDIFVKDHEAWKLRFARSTLIQ